MYIYVPYTAGSIINTNLGNVKMVKLGSWSL